MQAANAIGVGPFSTTFKFSTRPLPPDAPRLECVQASHNSLKLRWADGKNLDFINYFVEMQEEGSDKYLTYCNKSLMLKLDDLSFLLNTDFTWSTRVPVIVTKYLN